MRVYSPEGLIKLQSVTAFANPTASVGLTAVNGSANTAMRSDAAPALNTAIFTAAPFSDSFTITLTGVSGTVTATAKYTKIGNLVTLFIPQMSGTSNSTAKGFSGIPVAIRPTSIQNFYAVPVDSVMTSNVGQAAIQTGGTIILGIADPTTNSLSGIFTAAGTFTIAATTMTYLLN